MAYIIPSKRNREEIRKSPTIPIIPTTPIVSSLTCKWCHENDHLSLNCKFKGIIQEKRPNVKDNCLFPSLCNVDKQKEVSWGNGFEIDKFKERVSKIEETTLKRINSSTISLDTLTSNYSELDRNDIDSLVFQSNTKLSIHHPYRVYYQFSNENYSTDFLKWWSTTVH